MSDLAYELAVIYGDTDDEDRPQAERYRWVVEALAGWLAERDDRMRAYGYDTAMQRVANGLLAAMPQGNPYRASTPSSQLPGESE